MAGPDNSLQSQPANAIKQALRARRASAVGDLDLVEINEAFAAVGVAVDARARASTEEQVNVNGGAIALGHPIGMSGARIVLHLALELRRRGGGVGAAALCGGGGQGDALIVRVPARGSGLRRTRSTPSARRTSRAAWRPSSWPGAGRRRARSPG